MFEFRSRQVRQTKSIIKGVLFILYKHLDKIMFSYSTITVNHQGNFLIYFCLEKIAIIFPLMILDLGLLQNKSYTMSLKQSLATKQICKTMNLGKTMATPLNFTRLCRAQSAFKKMLFWWLNHYSKLKIVTSLYLPFINFSLFHVLRENNNTCLQKDHNNNYYYTVIIYITSMQLNVHWMLIIA